MSVQNRCVATLNSWTLQDPYSFLSDSRLIHTQRKH